MRLVITPAAERGKLAPTPPKTKRLTLPPTDLLLAQDFTQWMRGDRYKPTRPGWYAVRMNPFLRPHPNSSMYLTGREVRYFDGVHWRAGWVNEGGISVFGMHPSHEWRGLKQSSYRSLQALMRKRMVKTSKKEK